MARPRNAIINDKPPNALIPPPSSNIRQILRGRSAQLSLAFLLLLILAAVCAPWLSAADPHAIHPEQRLQAPFGATFLGTDAFGRDLWSRIVYGARLSLLVGFGATLMSVTTGLCLGLVAGWLRGLDGIIMRTMDALMAIPSILLAITLVALNGSSLSTVLFAITLPEVPRVVRLVRAQVLSIRTEPYVEAAQTLGTRLPLLLWRHILPATWTPLMVLGTYVFASAILTEAILSFLGAGIPPEIPSWGNIMAAGRMYFRLFPGQILLPGLLLAFTVLSINILGDALRDALDPHSARRIKP